MNAADVLAQAISGVLTGRPKEHMTNGQVAALLAHGEQGVAILPDGTLRALEQRDSGHWRLVPVSAEAGDTDG